MHGTYMGISVSFILLLTFLFSVNHTSENVFRIVKCIGYWNHLPYRLPLSILEARVAQI